MSLNPPESPINIENIFREGVIKVPIAHTSAIFFSPDFCEIKQH